MLRKLSVVAASLALAASITVTAFSPAEAWHRHRGVYVGGAALGLFALGATAAHAYDRDGCYRGPRQCHWVRGGCWRDRWGDRVCDEGHRECFRPLYCD